MTLANESVPVGIVMVCGAVSRHAVAPTHTSSRREFFTVIMVLRLQAHLHRHVREGEAISVAADAEAGAALPPAVDDARRRQAARVEQTLADRHQMKTARDRRRSGPAGWLQRPRSQMPIALITPGIHVARHADRAGS